MQTLQRQVASLLDKLVSESSLSAAEIARQAGVTPSYISQLRHGKANPTLTTLETILGVLGRHATIDTGEPMDPELANVCDAWDDLTAAAKQGITTFTLMRKAGRIQAG